LRFGGLGRSHGCAGAMLSVGGRPSAILSVRVRPSAILSVGARPSAILSVGGRPSAILSVRLRCGRPVRSARRRHAAQVCPSRRWRATCISFPTKRRSAARTARRPSLVPISIGFAGKGRRREA
jgi:hypothetical protein